MARLGGRLATGLRDVTDDPAALDSRGWWAVVAGFEGGLVCARFDEVRTAPPPASAGWRGPAAGTWRSSLDRAAYLDGVARVREHIAAGDVYQVNLCRVLGAPLPSPEADVDALTGLLARDAGPGARPGTVRLPAQGVEIATASPELYLRRRGRTVESGPIKGTARTAGALSPKEQAENVMIVDLVRNDLGRVCAAGSVTVPGLCVPEPYRGLVHLVSTVRGELAPGTGWAELLAATFPPGSVTGAPKGSALRIISALETAPRGPYCGGVGWVDADRGVGELAVGIRTFWIDRTGGRPLLRFGAGAGIVWDSKPAAEWAETELKAARLLGVASSVTARPPGGPGGHHDQAGEERAATWR
ncbi:chorismate-binding protein [Streptomyces hoynatensis]|uniref:Anthranilate synthase component I family protein n=1 Tax=Streptomyces hoynatensis TaxID=1141874 RepID=A0A3A9Z9W6_9ACTN|nr:chorismate-binding protein [Streptomyces hoynatensis]RKN45053.1 anthranilate synthase component I family protein [Streptomyces hoynatensis]